MLNNRRRHHKFRSVCLTICMRLFPPCEVMTRRSGLRLLAIWGLGGGGGDLARTTFPRLLPLETVRRPGEARALVYPLAARERGGGDRGIHEKNKGNQTGEKRQWAQVYFRTTWSYLKNNPPTISILRSHNFKPCPKTKAVCDANVNLAVVFLGKNLPFAESYLMTKGLQKGHNITMCHIKHTTCPGGGAGIPMHVCGCYWWHPLIPPRHDHRWCRGGKKRGEKKERGLE